jgi:hypothetical protein
MKQIGWQKYEDMLESQLESPLMVSMLQQLMSIPHQEEDMLTEEEQEIYDELGGETISSRVMLPLDDKMVENIALTSNFDCWMGHTNFDLTPQVRRTLDKIDGVEILKIVSRYRFFIGIGRMFDFKQVRSNIESQLFIKFKGDDIEESTGTTEK